MLEAFVKLITEFVSGTITVEHFEDQYVKLWHSYVDAQRLPPELDRRRLKLHEDLRSGTTSADDFDRQYRKLGESFWNTLDIPPFTPQSQIISDLFLEVDAYSNQEPYNVSLSQLRNAAQEALTHLNELQKERS